MSEKSLLTREALLRGDIARLVHHDRNGEKTMTDEQRAKLVQDTINQLGNDTTLWIFGYGSLIWNPALEFEEQRRCNIQGYQRKFCFWTTLSRGCEENPGLMMGLLEGGDCDGVAYRIAPEKLASELDILFRREMSSFVYKPLWIEARCLDSNTAIKTLTFVVDKENHRYVDNLTQGDIIRTVATAKGPLGRNCDYLFQLSEKLQELNLKNPELDQLVDDVKAFQKTM